MLAQLAAVAGLCGVFVNPTQHPVELKGCTWYPVDQGWACKDDSDEGYQPPLILTLPGDWHIVLYDADAQEAYFRLWDDWLHPGVAVHWRNPCPPRNELVKLWS